jgi:hypothetical protein
MTNKTLAPIDNQVAMLASRIVLYDDVRPLLSDSCFGVWEMRLSDPEFNVTSTRRPPVQLSQKLFLSRPPFSRINAN